MDDTKKPAPKTPPPPVFEPSRRWRLAPYLAELPRGGRPALTLEEVRALVPYGWAGSPAIRLKEAGYAYFKKAPRAHLRGDSTIWARRAEDDEVALGERLREAIQSGFGKRTGSSHSTSWHLPPEPSGSGVLRRWRHAKPDDKPEVLRTIRGAHWAPGEELVLRVGTSPARVAELVKEWVKGWAPTG